jgi:hypothetical protein
MHYHDRYGREWRIMGQGLLLRYACEAGRLLRVIHQEANIKVVGSMGDQWGRWGRDDRARG